MTQRPDGTRLRDWLDETVGQTPDPVEGTRQVMSQVEETTQVGRWLPFPVLHRKAKVKPPTTNHTTEYRPSPISANNGHTPTVIGRTQTMLSPVKAITAGALVFAIGGLFLIAQPFAQQGSVPGAEQGAELAPPVVVTITNRKKPEWRARSALVRPPLSHLGRVLAVGGHRPPSEWHGDHEGHRVLLGRATPGGNYRGLRHRGRQRQGSVGGTGRATQAREFGAMSMYTLNGEGEYEGLSAVLTQPDDNIIKGLIIEGGLPPFPELPAE